MDAPTARPYDVVILPDQATRIATIAVMTGAAVGLSQSGGSTITIHTADEQIVIDAQGEFIDPQKEHLFAEESHHVREL